MMELALLSRGKLICLNYACPRYWRLEATKPLESVSSDQATLELYRHNNVWQLKVYSPHLCQIEDKSLQEVALKPDALIRIGNEVILVVQLPRLTRTLTYRQHHPHTQHRPPVLWHQMLAASDISYGNLQMIAIASRLNAPIWIQGETGTGKELVASALHKSSARARFPFVALNCAALPEHLLEAELFGVVKGAYTGAHQSRQGAFVRAHLGTLFLDEVAELSLAAQAKLLRVLETGEVLPLGAERPIFVKVRVICACWKSLEEAVKKGQFRSDLMHRLWVLKLDLPALRERPEDIAPLVEYFLTQHEGHDSLFPSHTILQQLERAGWGGNIRELRNNVTRTVALDDPQQLLPTGLAARHALPRRQPCTLTHTLARFAGNRSQSAKALGISRSTLYRWLSKA